MINEIKKLGNNLPVQQIKDTVDGTIGMSKTTADNIEDLFGNMVDDIGALRGASKGAVIGSVIGAATAALIGSAVVPFAIGGGVVLAAVNAKRNLGKSTSNDIIDANSETGENVKENYYE